MYILLEDILGSVKTKINYRQQADKHQKHVPKPHRYLLKPSSKRAKGHIQDPRVVSGRARAKS